MAQRKPIAVVGSVNADLVIVSRLPRPGETVSATGGGVTLPGGKGANQAATAGKLGYPTLFVGQTGRDAAAGLLREALAGCGVSLEHTASVDAPTGQAVIILQPGGENSIVIVGGANKAWAAPPEAALDAVRGSAAQCSAVQRSAGSSQRLTLCRCAQVRGAGLLLLQREVPESVSLAAARAAAAAGVPVVLDAGGDDEAISDDLLRCVTFFSPNETELVRGSALTWLATAQRSAAQRCADAVCAHRRVSLACPQTAKRRCWPRRRRCRRAACDMCSSNSARTAACWCRRRPRRRCASPPCAQTRHVLPAAARTQRAYLCS
jgi:ribokinase